VELLVLHDAGGGGHVDECAYPPATGQEPWPARLRMLDRAFFAIVGIARDCRAAMHRRRGHDYAFFGAPVGLSFTLDRDLAQGGCLDAGLFMKGVMIAARA